MFRSMYTQSYIYGNFVRLILFAIWLQFRCRVDGSLIKIKTYASDIVLYIWN